MTNPLDELSAKVLEKRNERGLTQKQLAENLSMSYRTVIHLEKRKSSPKFETAALLAQYLNFSLDALVFPETASPNAVPKCVYDFFRDKTEIEAQKYISLCKAAEEINK